MGHKDDPQAKAPASVILTLAIVAAMELGGKHNKALVLAKDPGLFVLTFVLAHNLGLMAQKMAG
jgi:hypothetical protein